MSEEKIEKIYMLKDPRFDEYVKSVRYIGMTTVTLETRLTGHLYSDDNYNKRQWIKELRAQGLKPIIELIEECEGAIHTRERERFWVSHHILMGCNLLNVALNDTHDYSTSQLPTRIFAIFQNDYSQSLFIGQVSHGTSDGVIVKQMSMNNRRFREMAKRLQENKNPLNIETLEICPLAQAPYRRIFWETHYSEQGYTIINHRKETSQSILKKRVIPLAFSAYSGYLHLGVSSVSFDEWQGLSDDKKAFHALTDELFLETLQKVMSNPALWGDMLGRADE